MAPFIKAIALITAAFCFRTCMQPPVAAPTSADAVYEKSLFDKVVRTAARYMRALTLILFLCDAAVILSVAYPHHAPPGVMANLCPSPPSNPSVLLTTSPLFILAWLSTASATALRLWCYRTLGQFFTFEITLRPSHALITSGPYAYVRHPSYTGLAVAFAGAALMLLDEHGWARRCGGAGGLVGGGAVAVWVVVGLWSIFSVLRRPATEDRNMKLKFGDVWEKYARDVPYSLFPGLY